MSKASDPVTPDRLKEIRERAQKRMRELLFHAQSVSGTVPRTFSELELAEELFKFALSEREAAERETRMECARLVKSFQCSVLKDRKDVRPLIEKIVKAIHELAREKGAL